MGHFQETRLNLEPSSSAFAVDLQLPSTVAPSKSRRAIHNKTSADTHEFRARSCASASATYRRKHHRYPATFLWRVLDDDTVLSVRSIDLVKPAKGADASLILNFHFPHPIRPACVALADPPDHDALTIFVLDTANQLYTLFLRPESFRKRSFAETGLGDICKVHSPNSLKNFKLVYRLEAVSSDQLIASLSDGGLIRFDKDTTHNITRGSWKETFYNAKGWGLRNLLPHRGDIDATAAAASVHTTLGYDNTSLLLSVCLDHRIRVWDLNSGQILSMLDLLNAPDRSPQESGKWQLDPSQTNLIRMVGDTEGKRLCVTYSPIGPGEFKFWILESQDGNSITLEDALPGFPLIPKPPYGNDVWVLADFAVVQFETQRRGLGLHMWLLWKNNLAYRVQQLSFSLPDSGHDYTKLRTDWHSEWSTIDGDAAVQTAQESGPSDCTDVTEKWLKVILAAGRFPRSTIEAAVDAYERAVGRPDQPTSRKPQGLAEAVCGAVLSKPHSKRPATDGTDYEEFRHSSEFQWRKFYRILLELDRPRGEALSLAVDVDQSRGGSKAGLSWVVCADRISAIRQSSDLEVTCQSLNRSKLDNLQTLVATGQTFVEGFSDGMLQICNAVLRPELFEETTKMDHERIQFFSDKAGFWRQISDEDCNQVTDALGQNFERVSDELYKALIDKCNRTWEAHSRFPLTDLGRKIVLKATQDQIELQWNVCLSQLILLVHMEFEFDRPEEALHNKVDIGNVYRNLLKSLRRLELVRWLSNAELTIPLSRTEPNATSDESPVAARHNAEDFKIITALEFCVGHLLGFDSNELLPYQVTDAAADLCAADSSIELHAHIIQCSLLVRDRPDLAASLSPFCDNSAYSTYVQGRVFLALKDFYTAATCFKKAAYEMSASWVKNQEIHSSGLLNETERKLLFSGQPRYYSHIVALYEKHKAYSFVADFARLSLQFINARFEGADTIRMDMQSRLFNGALALSHFDTAHSTLIAMKDRAVQYSCLQKLVQKMCDNLHNAELVDMSFPGLQNAVDEILAARCRGTTDVITGIPYHQILYSWRIKRNDYRGAAAILLDRIQKLRQLGEGDQLTGDDVLDTAITRQYLMLINVLSCVEKKQAWITTEPMPSGGAVLAKRKVVTLADIRKEYQDELDRIAAIQNNQFGFAAGDEMEIL